MKRLALLVISLLAALPIPAIGAEAAPKPEPMKCNTGPVTRTYGKTQWLVYSCDDVRSVVIVSGPGNPATPFYFMFSPQDGKYRLYGEGTGRKDVTKAAFDELKTLSEGDVEALISESRKVPASKPAT